DEIEGRGLLDETYCIGEHAPVVIVLWRLDAASQISLGRRPGPVRIAGSAAIAPATSLTARVHHDVHVSARRPVQPLGRQAPAAVVADVLDHGRCRSFVRRNRANHPTLDRFALETGER